MRLSISSEIDPLNGTAPVEHSESASEDVRRNRDTTLAGQIDFDYSTPEAQAALAQFSVMANELRGEYHSLARKVRLYEASLGLAVAPVLLRRALEASQS